MRRLVLLLALVLAGPTFPVHAAPDLAPPFASASVIDPFCYRVVEGVTHCAPDATVDATTGRTTFAATIGGTGEVTVDTIFRTTYTQKERKPASIVFVVDVARAVATRSFVSGSAQLVATFTLGTQTTARAQVVEIVAADRLAQREDEQITVVLPTDGLAAGLVTVSALFAAHASTDSGVEESRVEADLTVSSVRAV